MRLWVSPWDHRSRGYPVACQLDAEPDEHDPGDAFEPALEGPFPGQCGQLRYQKHHGTNHTALIAECRNTSKKEDVTDWSAPVINWGNAAR